MKALALTCILSLAAFTSGSIRAGELDAIATQFITASAKGDLAGIAATYPTSGPEVDAILKTLEPRLAAIKANHVKVSRIDREFLIGDFGVTLIKVEGFPEQPLMFKPILCIKKAGAWKVLPMANERDLRAFAATRTDEDLVNLQLLNEWANLVEDMLLKRENQKLKETGGGAPSPAPGTGL